MGARRVGMQRDSCVVPGERYANSYSLKFVSMIMVFSVPGLLRGEEVELGVGEDGSGVKVRRVRTRTGTYLTHVIVQVLTFTSMAIV